MPSSSPCSVGVRSCALTALSVLSLCLVAFLTGCTATQSATVTVGPPAKLAVTTQPGNVAAGSTTLSVAVSIEDANGNVVTSANNQVTLAIQNNPSSGTLSGTLQVAAVNGVATFSNLSINNSGLNYTLSASATSLTGATTNPFNVFGTATKLAFTTQPGGGTGGSAWAQQPTVAVQDANGVTVSSSTASITLAITTGTGAAGAALTCTTNPLAATAGVATFAGCKINLASGTTYSLTATSAGLTNAVSNTFSVAVGAATQLIFTTSPNGGTGGTAWTTQAVVTVEDAGGNTVTASTASITLAITAGTGTAGATLACATNPLAATAGVATFAACKIDKAGAGYTLAATATGLTAGTSAAFTVTVGAASKLSFTGQPNGGTGGTVWTTQPGVTVEDAGGNTVASSTASIMLAVTGGTGAAGAVLTCATNPLAATAGVAGFAGCKINLASANAYSLTATSAGLSSAVSSTFNVSAGAATQLIFTTSPGGGTGGTAWAAQPVVTVEDAGGNTVTSSTASIALAITSGTGAAGAALTCTTNPLGATAGVATFAGCKINLASGTTYTLTGSSAGLTNAVSSTFSIAVGPASQLTFSASPGGGTAATPWLQQPAVTVEDAGGNTVTSSTASILLAITSGTGATGANLACTTNPLPATAGLATFAGCQINLASTGYTLTASAAGVSNAVSTTFTISPGPATQLTFTVGPQTTPQNTNMASISVAVKDNQGNTVTTSTASITLAITSGTGTSGATLQCATNPLAATAGVANFTNCQINDIGSNYTLTATTTGLTGAVSSVFNITISVGAATKLVFTTQPGGGTGGTAWAIQPIVSVQDANGNTVTTGTGSNASIALAITSGTGAAGAALTCASANPLAATAGVASFVGCKINLASGNTYTLTATATGLTNAVSNTFSVSIGAATQLLFTTQPNGGTGGTAWTTQPVVTVEDAGGNTVTGSSASIALAITSGTGTSGATLSCTSNTVSASAGVATFAACKIDKAGAGYTLAATATGLTGATSSSFSITIGAAAKLAFTTQPGGGASATAWTTQPVVTIEDTGGNTVSSSVSITLAITGGTGTSGAALTCTTNPLAAAAGVATFAGCKIDKAGNNYTLTATASGLTNATSSTFNIATGTATQLVFTTQPGGASGGTAFTTQPVITVEDAGGNTISSSSASITLAITSGTGASGAALTCTNNTLAATAGVATFAGCKIDKAGTGYTLTASASGLTNGVSSTFTVAVGTAAQLKFTTQPGGGAASATWAQQPAVTIQDAGGNTVTSSSASVQLSTTTGTGATGAVLTCTTNPLAASAGIATFAGCQINLSSTNSYTLTASSTGLTSAVSNTFFVASFGTATKLAFTTQPGGGTGGTSWAQQPVVAVEDASGNTVLSSSASITLQITSGTGATGAKLTCNSDPLSASSGVATFSGCAIDLASGGYTLTATATGLTNAVSSTFSIGVGGATKLAFTTEPGGGTGGVAWNVQPVVTVQDAGGNTITGSTAQITLAIVPGTGNGTLTCTATTVTASAGVATFAGCHINIQGTGYVLFAASTGLNNATSSAFNIAVGPAARLVFGTQPSGAVMGTAFTTQPVVLVKDAGADTVTSSTASITLTLTTGSGTLACTGSNTLVASAGVAAFTGCQISATGTGDVITATAASGVTNPSIASNAFNVEAAVGSAAKLAFTVQPTNTEVGVAISPAIQVTVEDSNGVPVTTATNQITLALLSNPGGTLGGTTVITATNGVATFSNVTVSASATFTYTLQASATGLASSSPSNQFTVFISQPPNCTLAPHGNEYLMTGHWAALIQGWVGSGTGFPLHQVFAISTDGNGGLNDLDGSGMGGQIDRQNGSAGASSLLSLTVEKAGSSYSIGQDATSSGYVGCMTLATSNGGSVHYWFALGGITGSGTSARASKATIVRWDDVSGTGGRGTGVMLPQDSTKFSLGSLSPNYAFGLSGVDPNGGPFAEAGAVQLNTTNGTTSFEFDSDDAGNGGFFTGGTGTVTQINNITNLTGRVTVASSVNISGVGTVNSTAIEYIVNNNEIFHLSADPFGGTTQFPIASGRLIVTSHGNFVPISGNFMIHMTGISTVSSGGGCTQNLILVDCADVNLVAVTAAPNAGTQTSSITGFSWEYSKGRTVTPNTITGITGTVDATSGRLSLSGGNAQQAPVFYLATPQTGTDATEPYVAFGAGSGTAGNIDPSALSGFVEIGASTNVTQSAIAGNYFFYDEMPGDNYVDTSVGVANVSSSGTVTGTQYAQSGSAGLQSASLSSGGGSTITVTNQDPVVPADVFPGIANVGPGSFGLTNGKRFVFFDEGSSGNSNAQFTVVDQQ